MSLDQSNGSPGKAPLCTLRQWSIQGGTRGSDSPPPLALE